jgi:AraC-like DNA-binding protein
MDWTFPMPSMGPAMPLAELRSLLSAVLGDLAGRLRGGALPLVLPDPPDRPDGSHWHAWPELFIQLTGRSRFITQVGQLDLDAGAALLFPPLLAHDEMVARERGPFANLVVLLRGRRLSWHLALPWDRDPGRPHAVRPDAIEDDALADAAACLNALARGPGEDARRGLLLAMCGLAREALARAGAPGAEGSDRVRRVLGLVQDRLGSSSLSVSRLAEWTGCHGDHLTRLFRRETGETLVAHIRRQRLERARELLADARLTVADVARMVGFADSAYFCRVWRQVYGGSPGAARRRR